MDMNTTTQPDSTQINADDLIGRSVIVTITDVRKGTAEQPVNIDVAEFPGRAYRPSKSMRRVLVAAWGSDTAVYAGRRMTLYRDPEVRFGKDLVGGLKISHLSDIDKPMKLALTVTRGKRAPHTVDVLPDAAPLSPIEKLKAEWRTADPERRAAIEAEVAALGGGA